MPCGTACAGTAFAHSGSHNPQACADLGAPDDGDTHGGRQGVKPPPRRGPDQRAGSHRRCCTRELPVAPPDGGGTPGRQNEVTEDPLRGNPTQRSQRLTGMPPENPRDLGELGVVRLLPEAESKLLERSPSGAGGGLRGGEPDPPHFECHHEKEELKCKQRTHGHAKRPRMNCRTRIG